MLDHLVYVVPALISLRCVHHYVFKNSISNEFALILTLMSFSGDTYVYNVTKSIDVLSQTEPNKACVIQYNLHMSFYIYTMFYMCKSRSIQLHHIVSMICCYAAYFTGYHHAMIMVFWATSISTPFLNLHYIYKEKGYKTLSILNFIIFFGCFLYFRMYVLWMRIIVPFLYTEVEGNLANSAKYTVMILHLINLYWIYNIIKKIKNELSKTL